MGRTGLLRRWASHFDHRAIDVVECTVSVALAILVAHRVGAANVSWAAFSGYMVMRGHAAETLMRGLLRVAGTVAGGLLAIVAAPLVQASPVLAAGALFVVATAGLFGALVARRSYAWLFFGLTFAMAVLDHAANPEVPLVAFVETRALEVLAGTLACVAVSLASTLTFRRWLPAPRAKPPRRIGWHPHAFRHAAQGGVALALLAMAAAWIAVPAPAQGAVTIMAVMLVPVDAIGPSGFAPVARRMLHRFIGCLAGGLFAAVLLLAARGSVPLLLAGALAGAAVGRMLENGAPSRRYVGTQFTLAVLVTLVPDDYAAATVAPDLDRLAGVVAGAILLGPVLLAWHAVGRSVARCRGTIRPRPADGT